MLFCFKVRHDWLNLRIPVWILDVGFLPDSEKVVTSTSYHQVSGFFCNALSQLINYWCYGYGRKKYQVPLLYSMC